MEDTPVTYKILGICGSPRKANTDRLLQETLKSAEAEKDVATETLLLRKMKINFCSGCFKCFDANDNDYGCQVFRDSMDEISEKLKGCDAVILASPVYFGGVTARTKAFMDRTEPLLRYAQSRFKSTLKNKVGAAITIGGNRHGGQETTLQAIHHFFFIHDMIIVGTGGDDRPGCYLGAAATTHPLRGRIKDAVEQDELGLSAARFLGKRVVETLRMIHETEK
jgi:multimeric flavodoxin WrbA